MGRTEEWCWSDTRSSRIRQPRPFLESVKAGTATAWIAFFPGRKPPEYASLPVPPALAAIARSSPFIGGGKRGRRKRVDYQAINNYRLLHPKASHQAIANRLRVPRSTVSRVLRVLSTYDLDTEDPSE